MKKEKYHFIGIGGIGMSALVKILLDQGKIVSGSDQKNSPLVEELQRQGAVIWIGQSSEHIDASMTIVYSSAVKEDNPEYQEAKRLSCRMLHRSELLGILMEKRKSLVVTGTHGKTTTSTLLASVLRGAQLKPAFAVGGIDLEIHTNGGWGEGQYFVAEGDESDGSFLNYSSFGSIVTNLEADHLDHYGTIDALRVSFGEFFSKISSAEHTLWCGDDPELRALKPQGVSYGFNEGCQLRISNYRQDAWKGVFDLHDGKKEFCNIEIPLIGKHNALNASAVFGLALRLGIEEEQIRKAFLNFKGVARRTEVRKAQSLTFIDDYGHHPTEIKVTIESVRKATTERRLVVVYQPHRYSRSKDCMGLFGRIFDDADHVIITDIYSAGEAAIRNVNAQMILEEVKQASKVSCEYVPRAQLEEFIKSSLRPHDAVLMIGAGDITHFCHDIAEYFQDHSPKKYTVGVVFGGRSNEHDISVMSAGLIEEALNREYYDIKYFGIRKDSGWETAHTFEETKKKIKEPRQTSESIPQDVFLCDIFFPIMHGPGGEDGMIQGFFDTIEKAYVTCGHHSCALCMDKAELKHLAIQYSIPTLPFFDFTDLEWKASRESILDKILHRFSFPMMVKPSHLGSSIGVCKVGNEEELLKAIDDDFKIDNHIYIEKAIVPRELEFAVMGNDVVKVPPPGEILTSGEVYSYEAKYGKNGMKTRLNAPLDPEILKEGKRLAERAYRIAKCSGYSRVDFFLENDKTWWLNEINPIPGFTPISLFPAIWKGEGVSYSTLLDELVILGLQRFRKQLRIFFCS